MQATRLQQAGITLLFILVLCLVSYSRGRAQQGTDDAKLQMGAQLYAENCVVCHGPEGQGRVGATLAKDWPSIRPDLEVKTTIARGVSGSPMPAWGQQYGGPLTGEQIDALTYYILSWQTGGPPLILPTPTAIPRPELTPLPNVSGDPNHGAILYSQNCAVCHGPNGEGRIGAQLAKDWPSTRPDLRIKSTISTGVAGSPMPAWGQENGGPLNESEIDDLVAFILTWSTPANPATITPEPAAATQPFPAKGLQTAIIILIVVIVLVIGGIFAFLGRRP